MLAVGLSRLSRRKRGRLLPDWQGDIGGQPPHVAEVALVGHVFASSITARYDQSWKAVVISSYSFPPASSTRMLASQHIAAPPVNPQSRGTAAMPARCHCQEGTSESVQPRLADEKDMAPVYP